MPKLVEESKQGEELQSEHILLKEDSMKYRIPPPFPQVLRGKKKASQKAGILEVLRQVKVNIPLLDIIKQVPAYAKFLKDLCTIKKGLGIEKKAFLTETSQCHNPKQIPCQIQGSRISPQFQLLLVGIA